MNSVANGKLFDNSDIEEVYIQSASGDAGTALGAALYVQHAIFGAKRSSSMEHSYWGPEYSEAEIREAIAFAVPESHGRDGVFGGISIRRYGDEGELIDDTATAIASGEVVGWYQGRSEWGPRALGNRSILADPRRADMRDLLNRKIKRRESFRPFAPSVLEERTGDWFTVDYPDPFMLKVYPVRTEKRDRIPAVTHVDGTGRLQTVSERGNRLYWNLIRSFEKLSGVPMLLNTSFNENEPIVNTPTEALDCFLRTKMDRLVIGNCVLISNREA
jgi:carbamoyltransferase